MDDRNTAKCDIATEPGYAGRLIGRSSLAQRLEQRRNSARQTEAIARQEADELNAALAILRSQPSVEAVLDALSRTGIL